MSAWPKVRDRLKKAEDCLELSDAESELKGEFTGTLRYQTTIAPGDYAHVDFLVSRLQ